LKVNLIATFPTLPPSGRDRVRMFRVEVDFEPSDAMVERAVHRVVHRVAERDRHQHRDQDGEEDAEVHNSVTQNLHSTIKYYFILIYYFVKCTWSIKSTIQNN
jgi:hypothetical protein